MYMQEAEKLMKLYVSELRKALRARGTADQCPRQDNFLGLIQVRIYSRSNSVTAPPLFRFYCWRSLDI